MSAKDVNNSTVKAQRVALQANTDGKGFGSQSPRDIDQGYDVNQRVFGTAPSREK